MAKCDRCGRDESMPYSCRYCGGTFCAEHRLPENHSCPGLEDWDDPTGVFDSGFDDSVRQSADGGGAAEMLSRVGFDTGRGGFLGYFRNNMTYVFLGVMWIFFFLQYLLVPFLLPPTGTLGMDGGSLSIWQALFTLSPAHPEYIWTWVTSVFAHGGFGHIAFNSIALYFFGPVVERRIGTNRYTVLFLGSGAIAGLAQIGTSMVLGDPLAPVLGASGAIMAILGVLTVLNPNLKVYLYFILPMPLWILTIGFAAISLFAGFSTLGGGGGGIAHFAHLAGLVIGLAYGERLRRAGERGPQQLRFGGDGRGRRRF